MSNTFITARNVWKSYKVGRKKIEVLQDISFTVMKGEFLAVMGPSGSGKTTLIYLLAGLDLPDKGRITIGESCLSCMGEGERVKWRRRNVGIIFQFFHLIPVLTVLENVMLPMELVGKPDRTKALSLLETVGMKNHANRFPSELSGGEQQRVAIARALAADPPLILADEPTANLDTSNKKRVVDLLRIASDMGKTVIMATHDPDLASMADRIIKLVDGRVVEE